jgi:hypothetical protein
MSYLTNTPVLNLAKILIDPSIQSYHLFRKYRTARGGCQLFREAVLKIMP